MPVRDWMTAGPDVVRSDTSVVQARDVMRAGGFRHLPVVDDGRLVGILSDHDLLIDDRTLLGLRTLKDLGDVIGDGKPVSDVMTANVYSILPQASIGDAARLMLSRRVSALPVVEEGGHVLLGIITTTDCLIAALARDAVLERIVEVDGHDRAAT